MMHLYAFIVVSVYIDIYTFLYAILHLKTNFYTVIMIEKNSTAFFEILNNN